MAAPHAVAQVAGVHVAAPIPGAGGMAAAANAAAFALPGAAQHPLAQGQPQLVWNTQLSARRVEIANHITNKYLKNPAITDQEITWYGMMFDHDKFHEQYEKTLEKEKFDEDVIYTHNVPSAYCKDKFFKAYTAAMQMPDPMPWLPISTCLVHPATLNPCTSHPSPQNFSAHVSLCIFSCALQLWKVPLLEFPCVMSVL
jgi:hypothetical protein